MTDQNVVDQSQQDPLDEPIVDFHSTLVGEGKRYINDEELAKANLYKDKHIKDLEAELSGQREHADILKNILDEVKGTRAGEEPLETPAGTNTQIHTTDVDDAIEEALERREVQRAQIENQAESLSRLTQHFSSREEAMRRLDTFMEVHPEIKSEMQRLMVANPDAFIRLFTSYNAPSAPTSNTPGVTGKPSADAIVASRGGLTWEQARQIRKEDPTKYKSQAFQTQLMASYAKALEEGKDFFGES